MASRPARRPEDSTGLGGAVLDALPINLYVVDREMRLVAWNSQRERGPKGRPRREVLGQHLRDVLSPHGFRATLPFLEQVFLTGEGHEEILESQGARLYHVRRLPVRGDRRGVTHVLSLFEDVTEQKALEMQVIATDRLAFLGQSVAGVAHEISNPLSGIAGCAEALASLALRAGRPGDRKEAREFRDLVRGEVARCERIVRSLLDSARPGTGQVANVADTVGSSLRLLERHPAFARIKVASRIPADLPTARIEPDSLKQVVMGLAVNAAKAMAGGGTLTLKAEARRGKLTLDVLDTGPGVPPELRTQIFKPYFTTSPPGQGTGLGLAIARSLVQARGGDLVCLPRRKGGGFRVVLKTGGERP